MTDHDFWSSMASFVSEAALVVDRPKGSAHPQKPELIYPLDYGYLTNLRSGDGDGVDVWIGTLKRRAITGIVCTVDMGKHDAEVKLLFGCTAREQRRILALHNQGNQRAVLIKPDAAVLHTRERGTHRGEGLPNTRMHQSKR